MWDERQGDEEGEEAQLAGQRRRREEEGWYRQRCEALGEVAVKEYLVLRALGEKQRFSVTRRMVVDSCRKPRLGMQTPWAKAWSTRTPTRIKTDVQKEETSSWTVAHRSGPHPYP